MTAAALLMLAPMAAGIGGAILVAIRVMRRLP